MIKSRKMTLENRIARLEKLFGNKSTCKFESFESDLDEYGARELASRLAKQFMSFTGISLVRSDDMDIVDSPRYGWLSGNDVEDIADDPDARYTFSYNVREYPSVTVYIRPTDETVCVWDGDMEGAVDPDTGSCNWADELDSVSYPISEWKGFDMNSIHDAAEDEEFESYRRPMRQTRNESTRKFTCR